MRQRLRDRIHGDFLMPSRLDVHERWLDGALRAGYEVLPVGRAWRLMCEGGFDPARRYLLLRHDVDTDPGTAAAMWEIERGLGIFSSYFFRLSTLDPRLMRAIEADGGEASYHFEELAALAKRRRVRTRAAALRLVPEARTDFERNLRRLRATTGLPMRVVASHGDFANDVLGLPNRVILEDLDFRRAAQIELETYDEPYLSRLPSRHTDLPHPRYWGPSDPALAVADGVPVISVLVHPRHWRVARLVNARDDLWRLVDGAWYGLPRLPWESREDRA
jgi:hypothetical protein